MFSSHRRPAKIVIASRRSQTSRQIVRRSKSNLALALSTLPRARKHDMMTFYAFCRVIDDLADDESTPIEERRSQLADWKQGLLHGFAHPDELQEQVAKLPARYGIDPGLLVEIIDGVSVDFDQSLFETFSELQRYCYKVASVVGLVSIEIFGCKNPASRDYAINLGYALQLTNIIRDISEDASRGRIYLPMEDLKKFNVEPTQILKHQFSENVASLLRHEYDRARHYFDLAASLLPKEDRRRLLAAEMMAQIYSEILEKIRRSKFRVFEGRVSLSKFRKLIILGAFTARGFLTSH